MTKRKRKLTPREIAARQVLEEQARLDKVLEAARDALDWHDSVTSNISYSPGSGVPVRKSVAAKLREALDEYERGEK